MNRPARRRGFSLIELMIVIAIMLVIAVIAIPNMIRAKMHAHEMAAIKTMQTIHTAQFQYETQYGRFATSLAELGPPEGGRPGAHAADLIDSGLAGGKSSGYLFSVNASPSGHAIGAVPVTYNVTGVARFTRTRPRASRRNDGPEPATAQSPLLRR